MPTIEHKPKWGTVAPGYDAIPPFEPSQVDQLAELLGCTRDLLNGPLADASSAIWRFQYSNETANSGEQAAALKMCAQAAEDFRDMLSRLDPASRRRLHEAYNDDTAALNADLRSLERLGRNLVVAQRSVPIKKGRPQNVFERVAAEKLIAVSEFILKAEFKNSGKPRAFVVAALGMLDIHQRKASGAIRRALKERARLKQKNAQNLRVIFALRSSAKSAIAIGSRLNVTFVRCNDAPASRG